LTLLTTTVFYSFSLARFAWNTPKPASRTLAFLSAAATYGIVVDKAYRARFRSRSMPSGQQSVIKILGDENVQYLCKSRASREGERRRADERQ
jgi:hypothetical protein